MGRHMINVRTCHRQSSTEEERLNAEEGKSGEQGVANETQHHAFNSSFHQCNNYMRHQQPDLFALISCCHASLLGRAGSRSVQNK